LATTTRPRKPDPPVTRTRRPDNVDAGTALPSDEVEAIGGAYCGQVNREQRRGVIASARRLAAVPRLELQRWRPCGWP
jgi:hypothetical protein